MEGDGVEIDVADEGEHLRRQVRLDGGVNQAVVHILAEKVLGVV